MDNQLPVQVLHCLGTLIAYIVLCLMLLIAISCLFMHRVPAKLFNGIMLHGEDPAVNNNRRARDCRVRCLYLFLLPRDLTDSCVFYKMKTVFDF